MLKHLFITFLTFGFLLLLSQNTYACLCGAGVSLSAEGTFTSSNAVFVGKVIEIKSAKQVNGYVSEELLSKYPKLVNRRLMFGEAQIVKLEITNPLKSVTEKIFELVNSGYKVETCGVPFKLNETYLVFADQRQMFLSKEETAQPKESWTKEMLLKEEADKFNEPLPLYEVNSCSGTGKLTYMKQEVEEIHNFLKNGVWSRKSQVRRTILY